MLPEKIVNPHAIGVDPFYGITVGESVFQHGVIVCLTGPERLEASRSGLCKSLDARLGSGT